MTAVHTYMQEQHKRYQNDMDEMVQRQGEPYFIVYCNKG